RLDLPEEAYVLDARRCLRHARRARLRMVCRARGARRGPTRNGAKPRPRPRESAEGQLLGHGAQAPASEKADEIARDSGGHSARGGGAVAELKRSSELSASNSPNPPSGRHPSRPRCWNPSFSATRLLARFSVPAQRLSLVTGSSFRAHSTSTRHASVTRP